MLKPSILKIFAKSPIKPMQQHMAIIGQCVDYLLPFFQHTLKYNWEKAKVSYDNIILLSNNASNLKKEIRLHIPTRLLLPIDRGDLIGLLKSQDKIANITKKLVNLIYYREMQFPEDITKSLLEFVQLGMEATKLAKNAIDELDQLVETGFIGKEAELVENIIVDLENLEKNSENMQNSLRKELFVIESSLKPIFAIGNSLKAIDVIFLYKVIDYISDLADNAQEVGHKLELLLITR